MVHRRGCWSMVVIWLFLGDTCAMLIPAATLPVSLVATFIALYVFGYSSNLLTLLALVLAIGLVVDDAIVRSRTCTAACGPAKARRRPRGAARGRSVSRWWWATRRCWSRCSCRSRSCRTTSGGCSGVRGCDGGGGVVLGAGRADAVAGDVLYDARSDTGPVTTQAGAFTRAPQVVHCRYRAALSVARAGGDRVLLAGASFRAVPTEFAPREDRGSSACFISGTGGFLVRLHARQLDLIERRIDAARRARRDRAHAVARAGRFSRTESYSAAIGSILNLPHWDTGRRPAWERSRRRRLIADVPGVQVFPTMPRAWRRVEKPVQFVIGGGTFEELA